MDLWVVAVAAGAGYIAKNLQNLSLDKKESQVGSSCKYTYKIQSEPRNFLQQLREKTCPLRRLAQKRAQDDALQDLENHSDAKFQEIDVIGNRATEAVAASTSADASEESVKFEDGESTNFNRGKFIRSRRHRVQPLRPLNSIGGFLDSQLCMERENVEDTACLYPSMSTVGPVLVTDGSRITSRSGSYSSFSHEFEEERLRENGVTLKVSDTMLRSCSLEQFESVEELERRQKMWGGNLQQSGSGDGVTGGSQGPDSMFLFITGMTIGILSATSSWKNEVDKLNKQLKQVESLVQDLHEELDMKEMLIVKDLTDASGEIRSPLSIQEPIISPSDVKLNKSTDSDSLKANDTNREHLELLSKIEAELQSELEMLEHNMKASTLERISTVVEIDPDFEPDIVQGDLNPIMANGTSESGSETTFTGTNCSKPANYAVSPWELSMRLHELIESRLEMRIDDLQIALDNSQKLVQFLGSQSIVSARVVSHNETELSSPHRSPICDDHDRRENGTSADNFSSNCVSDGDCESEDEGTDESEMLLIKQIVQRSRSGSGLNLKI